MQCKIIFAETNENSKLIWSKKPRPMGEFNRKWTTNGKATTRSRIRSAVVLLFAILPSLVKSQFCRPLQNNTWSGFVQAVDDAVGFAVLCPFEISGDRCHSEQDYPNGFQVKEGQDLIIVCDPFLYGYNIDSRCAINCPGRHFTVESKSSLTLHSIYLQGATNSSIHVESEAKLRVIDSTLHKWVDVYRYLLWCWSNRSQFFKCLEEICLRGGGELLPSKKRQMLTLNTVHSPVTKRLLEELCPILGKPRSFSLPSPGISRMQL